MSIHINAERGQIAGTVLLPGDPLRAQFIAETFLTEVECYNRVRNILGFTGRTADGRRVSVQGSGMGMPSLSIYASELFDAFGANRIIRVGSCGSLQPEVHLHEIIIAAGACSDSAINMSRFHGKQFAPLASWQLLMKAHTMAEKLSIPVRVGNVVSTDLFYNEADPDAWELWADYGVLAIEMEAAELYTLAAKKGFEALALLTVSDNLATGKQLPADEREKGFTEMVRLALEL